MDKKREHFFDFYYFAVELCNKHKRFGGIEGRLPN